MPFCPECGAEYRKGFTECADCGVELDEEEEKDQLFADDEDELEEDELMADDSEETELIEIFSGPPYAAGMLAGALKEKGIIAQLKPEISGTIIPPTESSVYVTEEDYNKHDDLIEQCMELVMVEPGQAETF